MAIVARRGREILEAGVPRTGEGQERALVLHLLKEGPLFFPPCGFTFFSF